MGSQAPRNFQPHACTLICSSLNLNGMKAPDSPWRVWMEPLGFLVLRKGLPLQCTLNTWIMFRNPHHTSPLMLSLSALPSRQLSTSPSVPWSIGSHRIHEIKIPTQRLIQKNPVNIGLFSQGWLTRSEWLSLPASQFPPLYEVIADATLLWPHEDWRSPNHVYVFNLTPRLGCFWVLARQLWSTHAACVAPTFWPKNAEPQPWEVGDHGFSGF